MALQMIFCLEANKQSASDYVYIRDTINRFYKLNNKIKIATIYMNGKSNYSRLFICAPWARSNEEVLIVK